MNLIPYLRMYSAGLWKKTQVLQEFLDPILTFKCPPGVAAEMTSPIWYCFVFCFCVCLVLFFLAYTMCIYGNILSTNGVEGEITPLLCTTSIMQLFFKRRRHGEASYAALDIYSKQAECWVNFAFRALGLQLHIAITELLKGHSYVQ